jgi:hypothetical protein
MADERVAEIVEAMQRELSPELVTALTDLPLTEVPEGLAAEVDVEVEPYDPAHPDRPEGTNLDCPNFDEPNGHDVDDVDERPVVDDGGEEPG